jgi:hypothetical protein
MIDLESAEKKIMDGLKDFQQATVERVFSLFKGGQNRVLVADEVGLGKTLVAKGVIAKVARLHQEEGDNLFKVVYICSNQNIANQNINKLIISPDIKDITVDGVSDTRLSMQHLKIFEQENNPEVLEKYIQLIPLTPDTSFRMTSGSGSVSERALMFAILKRMPLFSGYLEELETVMMDMAYSAWGWVKKSYENRVTNCESDSNGEYIRTMTEAVGKKLAETGLADKIIDLCQQVRDNGGRRVSGISTIGSLRMLFARISVDFLNPDIVIMDEFQRFKYLISADAESETGILAQRFLNSNNVKVLLLSATPYKLYSTLEEINETQCDDHYAEFFQVTSFLFNDKSKHIKFKDVWNSFSVKLRELQLNNLSIIYVKKDAEDALYQGVCRTERISAMKNGDFIDDSGVRQPLRITEKDVQSYIQAQRLLEDMGTRFNLPVDYIKSSPYILSFMRHYQLKRHVEKYFKEHPLEIKKARKNHLWVDERKLRNYDELDDTNARFERLKKYTFENKAEMLLWVPASKPYYEPRGVFRGAKNFSKILVFSAWELVPRMIASLISYEAERKTVGKLNGQAQKEERVNAHYFAPNSKRYPVARLRLLLSDGEPRAMRLFCLLYPSEFLSGCFNPIECMNKEKRLKDIERDIKAAIELKLGELGYQKSTGGRADDRWYYLAPLLMDTQEHVASWLKSGKELLSETAADEEEKGLIGFTKHLEKLREYYNGKDNIQLGRMPGDLLQVLVNMSIASPAVCAYRANGGNSVHATQLAKIMLNRLNTPESTAIIDLCYGKTKDDKAHWKNVLRYFKDGNFQAVLDEYVHILAESNSMTTDQDKGDRLQNILLDSVTFHSASYNIDTYDTFKNNINGGKAKSRNMRSHFAVGYYRGEGDSSQLVNRKESIRGAFNSPFRPFVLATTSVGQEGLDFHFYCRKIIHWNLPSNPIDLEQREGRINRFKCLAIRQNVGEKYGSIQFKKDIWPEMFDNATNNEKGENSSDLIPFWCLSEDQDIKIERIIPMYPLSRDAGSYERLMKILSLYRLTLGQARQEDLLDHIFQNCDDIESLKKLFINLSPYFKENPSLQIGTPLCITSPKSFGEIAKKL